MSEDTKVEDETTEKDSSTDSTVDYKAEYARLQAERDKYKEIANNQRIALQRKNKAKQEDDEESEDPGVELIGKALEKFEAKRRQEDVEDILEGITSNADERDLIRHIYENDLRQSGFSKRAIQADLEKARILANRSKYEAEAERKVKKGIAEETAMRNAGSSSVRSKVEEATTDVKLNRTEKSFVNAMNRYMGK